MSYLKLFFLILCITMPARVQADAFWTTVTWKTPDGLHMTGWYHAADRPGQWTWVLLHGYASNKGEWGPLADGVAKQHQGLFVYDLRGHGDSTRTDQGPPIDYRTWGKDVTDQLPTQMPNDLAQVVNVLHTRLHLDRRRIAVGGASLGANIAMVYATSHTQVPAVILLSPGMNFGGISIEGAFQTFSPKPLFLAASPGDSYSAQTVQYLSALRHDDALVVIQGPGSEHGVNMFKDADFLKSLEAWMKATPRTARQK